MSFKHFGAAVAVAGLLTGFPIAPVELAQGIYGIKETSDNGGPDPFGAVGSVSVANSKEVTKVNGADAPNTRSPVANDLVSGNPVNILPTATTNNFSIPPVIDPLLLQTTFDKGNFNNVRTKAKASARRRTRRRPDRRKR